MVSLLLIFSGIAFADYLNCPCKVVKVTGGDIVNEPGPNKKSDYRGLTRLNGNWCSGKSRKSLAQYVAVQNVEVEYDKRDRY